MTEQPTEEKPSSAETSSSGEPNQSSDETASSSGESSGGSSSGSSSGGESSGEASSDSSSARHSAPSPADDRPTEQQERPAASGQSGGQPTEQQPTEQQSAPRKAATPRGNADTSWAEPEGTKRRGPSVDIGEVIWRGANVVASLARTLCLIFALILIVNMLIYLVGVNTENGAAQFVTAVAVRVVLGFGDLFVTQPPLTGFIVDSLIAAGFWAFLGELLSRGIRFLAARVN